MKFMFRNIHNTDDDTISMFYVDINKQQKKYVTCKICIKQGVYKQGDDS